MHQELSSELRSQTRCTFQNRSQLEKKLHTKSQSYLVFRADDASPVRFLFHVLVTMAVIVRASFHFIPHSSFRPACFRYPRVRKTRLFPPAQLRSWTMHVAVCAVWIRPHPHTHTFKRIFTAAAHYICRS